MTEQERIALFQKTEARHREWMLESQAAILARDFELLEQLKVERRAISEAYKACALSHDWDQ